jgi:hypothetical protein
MNFNISTEQQLIVDTVRAFVERELIPHEAEVERTDRVAPELAAEIKRKAVEAGLFAANMPEAIGGGGLDAVRSSAAPIWRCRCWWRVRAISCRPARVRRWRSICYRRFAASASNVSP